MTTDSRTDTHTADLALMPRTGAPRQLLLLMHGVGANAANLLPLGRVLQAHFPEAAVISLQGYDPFDGMPHDGSARQWFSIRGDVEADRPARVAAVLPRFVADVRAHQQRLGIGEAATALVGFSQGAILALEAIAANDGLAGRVLAFSGRYASLPAQAPKLTTLHFFHGSADPVIPVRHAKDAMQHLAQLEGSDATIDIAEGIGHELHATLLDCALHRLTHHIPMRTWQAALGGVAAAASPNGGETLQ
ncbi:esterase [Leptothrix discophora]|uniref:Esterase n=1 Tax=Leptothrix discophora TaxID=89 RepID=A0ABT9G5F8_LEPDI|nr:esterase [Leptothrix discophora]MDP4301487.1 esterase [Leptothrix discophora]